MLASQTHLREAMELPQVRRCLPERTVRAGYPLWFQAATGVVDICPVDKGG